MNTKARINPAQFIISKGTVLPIYNSQSALFHWRSITHQTELYLKLKKWRTTTRRCQVNDPQLDNRMRSGQITRFPPHLEGLLLCLSSAEQKPAATQQLTISFIRIVLPGECTSNIKNLNPGCERKCIKPTRGDGRRVHVAC